MLTASFKIRWMVFTIWTNYFLPPAANEIFDRGVASHRLLKSANMSASNLAAGATDQAIREAEIIFGQPDPAALFDLPKLKWVHLSSAGYDRYDRADLRKSFAERGAVMTNSSAVYEEPCAQHVLAMMLALSRQLPQCLDEQRGERSWSAAKHRIESYRLTGQTVVILSYGSIAKRLIGMLEPFRMRVIVVRREVRGDEKVEAEPIERLGEVLPLADHVVNILPGGEQTRRIMDAKRFLQMKRGAKFYNIGRGTTVDQEALWMALGSGFVGAAYLDVTDPEPLPPDNWLWSQPRCFITPHTAGGSVDEFEQLAGHFLNNLERFSNGRELINRVI